MRKVLNTLPIFIFLCMLVFLMASCNDESNNNQGLTTTTSSSKIQTTTSDDVYYTITFKDYDGTILQTSSVKSGDTPTYNKDNPVREDDNDYSYTFSGWKPAISKAQKDAVYTAEYSKQSVIDAKVKSFYAVRESAVKSKNFTLQMKKAGEDQTIKIIPNITMYDDNKIFSCEENKKYWFDLEDGVWIRDEADEENPSEELIRWIESLEISSYNSGIFEGGDKYNKVVTMYEIPDGFFFSNSEVDVEVTKINQTEITLPSSWEDRKIFTYKVEYYHQNIDDNDYSLYETEIFKTKTANTQTNVIAKYYRGFRALKFDQANINEDNSTVVKIYYDRDSFEVYLDKNIDVAGSVTGSGRYRYDKEITITATTNKGYVFSGWYYGDELLSEDATYTFNVEWGNHTYFAKWVFEEYTITIDNQAEGLTITGVTSGNKYEYRSIIKLTATNVPTGYSVMWTRSDNKIYIGNEYEFQLPFNDITITVTMDGSYIREGNKIYFGTYPQTLVNPTIANGLSSIEFNSTWNKYIGAASTTDCFIYYKDVDIDKNGTYDYRGIYFKTYRPYNSIESTLSSSNSYQDDNGYLINKIYWFSYDPIEWDILAEGYKSFLIIANLILDNEAFYPSNDTRLKNRYDYNDSYVSGYSNNYKLSDIRKFLNTTFYETAFNDLQKELILITEVDNSPESTGTGHFSNKYACANTKDKMFLLSEKEVDEYYSDYTARLAKGTDYAKCLGLYVYTDDFSGYSRWWLRSPSPNHGETGAYICNAEDVYSCVVYYIGGVRPVCWITPK